MKLTDLEIDVDAVDNGAWVKGIPDMGDIAFRVRGSEYAPYQKALRAAMTLQGRRQRLANQLDMDKFQAVQHRLIAEHLLQDWAGLETPEGTTLPYDRDTALEQAERHLKSRNIVQKGDVYAITCGEPMGAPGGTNMLKICVAS